MRRDTYLTLRNVLTDDPASGTRVFRGSKQTLAMREVARVTARSVAGKSVMLAVREQFDAARALVALDGVAARLVVCPPGIPDEHRAAIAAKAAVDIIVDDEWLSTHPFTPCDALPDTLETEWLLLTSGTTGVPKLVSHNLRGLTGAILPPVAGSPPVTWATLYDIRRYGGLQIFLRGVVGAQALIVAASDETMPAFLERCAGHGVTHMSGTPSHWRSVLMHPPIANFGPAYVRLSGEIADQPILDALPKRFPHAKIGHAYASTEAGVGFEVNDGLAGFPAAYLDGDGPVAMKVEDDTLRIRSQRTASTYVGEPAALRDADEFVDTGDIVQRHGNRYHFIGRSGGIINIGGQKVHPEEVEAIINRHSAVRMSMVKGRRSPITGAIVAAEIVLSDNGSPRDAGKIRQEIETNCRAALPAWKVPASIRFVPALAMTAAGKLARHA